MSKLYYGWETLSSAHLWIVIYVINARWSCTVYIIVHWQVFIKAAQQRLADNLI